MAQWGQLTHCHRDEQTATEEQVPRGWSMQHAAAGRGARCPEQAQACRGGVRVCESLERIDAWQQIGLLFLHQHRPAQVFLQASHAPMALSTGENDWGCTACRQLLQGLEAAFGQGRAVDQDRLRIAVKPPGGAPATVAIGGKQP